MNIKKLIEGIDNSNVKEMLGLIILETMRLQKEDFQNDIVADCWLREMRYENVLTCAFLLFIDSSLDAPDGMFDEESLNLSLESILLLTEGEIEISLSNLEILIKFSQHSQHMNYIYELGFKRGLNIISLIGDETYNKILNSTMKLNDFTKHVVENLTNRNPIILFNCIGNKELFEYLLDNGFNLNTKINSNMDLLVYTVFSASPLNKVKFLMNYVSSISSDKFICLNNERTYKTYFFDIVKLISSLENFDDFVNNNKDYFQDALYMEDCEDFMRGYIDIE